MFAPLLSEEASMDPARLIRRLLARARRGRQPLRTEVCPPATWGQAEPVWRQLLGWLRRPGETPAPAGQTRLELARQAFEVALRPLQGMDARDLGMRCEHARSLRELWHLRAELYGLLARQQGQAAADRQLAEVNRHFPSRTTTARPGVTHHGQELGL